MAQEPVRKTLTCPGCGQPAVVRVLPGGTAHQWHCPHCHKVQTSDPASVDAAAVVAD